MKNKKFLVLVFSVFLAFILAACDMAALGATEEQNPGGGTVSGGSSQPTTTERNEDWYNYPPMKVEYTEGEPSENILISYSPLHAGVPYGFIVSVENTYAADISQSWIEYNGERHPVVLCCCFNKLDDENPNILYSRSGKNASSCYELYIGSEPSGDKYIYKYTPTYTATVHMALYPDKTSTEPVFYTIKIEPDGWTEDEFPLDSWEQWLIYT